MPSFAELIQQSSGHAWLFIPSAVLLGALHGLEPGHSKTMMAAFIVAIRGTVTRRQCCSGWPRPCRTRLSSGASRSAVCICGKASMRRPSSPISSSPRPPSSSASPCGCSGAPGRIRSGPRLRPAGMRTGMIILTAAITVIATPMTMTMGIAIAMAGMLRARTSVASIPATA